MRVLILIGDGSLLDRKGYEYGFKFLTTQPGQVPMSLLGKLLNFWEAEVMTRSGYHVVPLLGVIVLPLYLIGLILHWRRSLHTRMAVAFIAAALFVALVFCGRAIPRAGGSFLRPVPDDGAGTDLELGEANQPVKSSARFVTVATSACTDIISAVAPLARFREGLRCEFFHRSRARASRPSPP